MMLPHLRRHARLTRNARFYRGASLVMAATAITFTSASSWPQAAQNKDEAPPTSSAPAVGNANDTAPSAAPAAASGHTTMGALSTPPPSKEGCPLCPVSNKEELQVLMQLRERHTLLMARENVVAQKEAALVRLEESLDAQLTRFDVSIGKLESRLDVGEAQKAKREAQLKTLVQMLQGLSAKKAAPMLAEASPDFVAEIFRQLGSARVAALLAVMPASKAGKLIELSVDAPPKAVSPDKTRPKVPAKQPPAAAAAADAGQTQGDGNQGEKP